MFFPVCRKSTPSFPWTAIPAVVSSISWFLPCWIVLFMEMFLSASRNTLFSPSMISLWIMSWLALREMPFLNIVPLFTMFLDDISPQCTLVRQSVLVVCNQSVCTDEATVFGERFCRAGFEINVRIEDVVGLTIHRGGF